MKKILTLFSVLSVTSVLAQPTIQFSNVGLEVGDTYTLHNLSGDLDEGNSGANVTWDFSDLPAGTTASSTILAAADAPGGASFPNANIAVSDGGGAYGFSSSTSASMSFCGINTGFYIAYYDDPEDLIQYPFTYNDDYVDTYHSTFTTGVEFERNGTVTVEADAWGTLILPWGTIQNALRVHTIEEATDDSDAIDLTYYTEMYTWYAPGYHVSLLSTSAQSVNGGAPSYLYWYSGETSAQASELSPLAQLEVYPNPATDQVRIEAGQGVEYIELADASGKLIDRISALSSTIAMDVSELPSGVYLVTVYGKNERRVKQLLKN